MAIRVICPRSCRLQVPVSRAGALLRCPGCSELIRVSELAAAVVDDDGMQALAARLATGLEIRQIKQQAKVSQLQAARKQSESIQEKINSDKRWRMSDDKSDLNEREKARITDKIQPVTTSVSSRPSDSHRAQPAGLRREVIPAKGSNPANIDANVAKRPPALPASIAPASTPQRVGQPPAVSPNKSSHLTSGVIHTGHRTGPSMMLAIALVLIGLFLLFPVIAPFSQHASSGTSIPRYTCWLAFAGFLHFFLAVYAWQLADWTSMWTSAILLLILTFLAAVMLGGLAFGSPGETLQRALQIPHSLGRRAEIWLLMLLTLTSLTGYLSGREAFRWKRAENR